MYENMTYEAILERMLSRVSDKLDKREGAVIWDTHSPTAIELELLYIELDQILTDGYGDTARREWLIKRAAERGIYPYPASHAILRGEFTPDTIEMTGRRFSIEDLNYTVGDKIEDGAYEVMCETPGEIGNRYLGNMIPIDYIAGLQTAKLVSVLVPGEDEEDTEELRQRYKESFNTKAFGGNRKDYIEKTESIPGVGRCKVTRAWNSNIRPGEMIPDEKVDAWYQSVIGTLDPDVANWLETVYGAAKEKKLTVGGTVLVTILDSENNPATSTLCQQVLEVLDPEGTTGEGYGIIPIGHVVSVKSAEAQDIIVKTNLTFAGGYSWDNMQDAIDETIEDYFKELRGAWADSDYIIVRKSQIEAKLLSLPGIQDVEHTTLNGSDENVILGAEQVPIFGGAGPND